MDAQRHGVKFKQIDVQESDYDYTIEGADVRVGFRALYGLKQKHIDRLIAERHAHGKFRDLQDLVRRTSLHKPTLLCLAAAGALNSLGLTPREALWKVQSVNVSPASLFFGQSSHEDQEHVPQENNWSTLQREYGSQGFSLVHHPLGILRPTLDRWSKWQQERRSAGFTKAMQLPALKNGINVRVAGLLSLQQRPPTAKGFAFLTLEDETGLLNVIMKPHIYEQYRLTVLHNPLLHVYGKLQSVNGVINIQAEIIRPLPAEKLLKATPDELSSGFDFANVLTITLSVDFFDKNAIAGSDARGEELLSGQPV